MLLCIDAPAMEGAERVKHVVFSNADGLSPQTFCPACPVCAAFTINNSYSHIDNTLASEDRGSRVRE